ncbi:MAG: hypothetical protein JRI99_14290 [Deltaproteobacteria bacterium]|nr:hypothetical protein [Deltaproteobacteria bacterium]
MKRKLLFLGLFLTIFALIVPAASARLHRNIDKVKVMTRNLYLAQIFLR